VLTSFVAGALAGYAIAIPVGAIAILIVELGIRRGFRIAAAAGAGAAAADGFYATLAVLGGTAIAAALEPLERPLRIVAIGALLGIGLRGLIAVLLVRRRAPGGPELQDQVIATFARFLGLTLLNPATVIYFAALVLALPDVGRGPGEHLAFAGGAFLASLSWQTTLAAVSAVAHRRLPRQFQVIVSIAGNVAICGFAVLLAGQL
jgi:threonine/homoserine/homoserine lactone efflux protein